MKFIEFVEAHDWTFAKSMPWTPHEYLLRKNAVSEKLFEGAVKAILEKGVLMLWGKKAAKPYLDVGEWRYWIMEDSPQSAKLINRELISKSKAVPV